MIYKITHHAEWKEAQTSGVFVGAPIDKADGYIHFSTAEQVAETADKHFKQRDDLLLIAVDERLLGDDLKWEVSRGGALFPHLYGKLMLNAVVWEKPLPLGDDGKHDLPALGT